MARLTRIYTRTGDDGTTGLGYGARVGKDDLQVEAYGAVDELNAVLGVALAGAVADDLRPVLERIQSELLNLGGALCLAGGEDAVRVPAPLIDDARVERLEHECDRFNAALGPLANFVLPGGSGAAAQLHVARTVCRRAERRAVALSRRVTLDGALLRYLNRLSDFLFIAARYENHARGGADVLWDTNV